MLTRHAAALFAATTLLAVGPAGAAPSSWTLAKVTFVGNNQVSTDELQAALPIHPGDKLEQADLQSEFDAVQQVYRKHNVGATIGQRFSAIGRKATITYTLTEQAPAAPTVVGITADSVTVTGNKKVSTAEIVAAANIPPGSEVTNDKIRAAQTSIAALYKKKNIGVSVGTDWTNNAPQHVALVFKIVETP